MPERREKMNKKLVKAMQEKGDTQQELAEYLGLHSCVSINNKIHGRTGWKKEQIAKICKKYKKTKEELGF
jgi:transcriptional regulator with XRE-family HTH domain